MSISTLFAANVVVLLVTAVAFRAAWQGQQERIYWHSWIAANLMLAAALSILMSATLGQSSFPVAVAHCLLVAGFGLRWRAARQFGGRPAPLLPAIGATICSAALFAAPGLFDHGFVFTAINVILTAQALAAGCEFWRDRRDGLPSRYGLVLAYVLMALSFAARVGQGLISSEQFETYLPRDLMLQAHLLVALFYTAGSGAFALSLAYESSAAELRQAALTDPLTGLHNRRAFEVCIREHLAQADRGFAVVLFDIDHFKSVNDRYGHAAGDVALRACAEICARTMRGSDFIARIGGEEFAAILPDTSAQDAYEITDRVRRAIEAHDIGTGALCFRLTLSAGIACSMQGAGSFDDMMRDADVALYRAKASGRNRVEQAAA